MKNEMICRKKEHVSRRPLFETYAFLPRRFAVMNKHLTQIWSIHKVVPGDRDKPHKHKV